LLCGDCVGTFWPIFLADLSGRSFWPIFLADLSLGSLFALRDIRYDRLIWRVALRQP
jgi:hypothetical protein